MVDFKALCERTDEAFKNPRVGDRFHEMYSFYVYVVGLDGDRIFTLEASPPCTLPDDGKLREQTLQDFRTRFHYGTIPGTWVHLADRSNDVSGWLEHARSKATA